VALDSKFSAIIKQVLTTFTSEVERFLRVSLLYTKNYRKELNYFKVERA